MGQRQDIVDRFNGYCVANNIPIFPEIPPALHACRYGACEFYQVVFGRLDYICMHSRQIHSCGPQCEFLVDDTRGEGRRCSLTGICHDIAVYSYFGVMQRPDNEDNRIATLSPDRPVAKVIKVRAKSNLASPRFKEVIYSTILRLLNSPEREHYDTLDNLHHRDKKLKEIDKDVKRQKLTQYDSERFERTYVRHIRAGRPPPAVVPNDAIVRQLTAAIAVYWATLFPAEAISEKQAIIFTAVCLQELALGTDKTGAFPKVAWLAAAVVHHPIMYGNFVPITPRSMTSMLNTITLRLQPVLTSSGLNPGFRFPVYSHSQV